MLVSSAVMLLAESAIDTDTSCKGKSGHETVILASAIDVDIYIHCIDCSEANS